MYRFVLGLHNVLRWAVVVFAIFALARMYWGWIGKRAWSDVDRWSGVFFTIALDTQLLVGVLLYVFFSPLIKVTFNDFGAAMSNPGLRFFSIEHVFYMVLSVVFVHIGNARIKRVSETIVKHRQAAIWFSFAFLILMLGIPWISRPLVPTF